MQLNATIGVLLPLYRKLFSAPTSVWHSSGATVARVGVVFSPLGMLAERAVYVLPTGRHCYAGRITR